MDGRGWRDLRRPWDRLASELADLRSTIRRYLRCTRSDLPGLGHRHACDRSEKRANGIDHESPMKVTVMIPDDGLTQPCKQIAGIDHDECKRRERVMDVWAPLGATDSGEFRTVFAPPASGFRPAPCPHRSRTAAGLARFPSTLIADGAARSRRRGPLEAYRVADGSAPQGGVPPGC
jgi:hypothetical protein